MTSVVNNTITSPISSDNPLDQLNNLNINSDTNQNTIEQIPPSLIRSQNTNTIDTNFITESSNILSNISDLNTSPNVEENIGDNRNHQQRWSLRGAADYWIGNNVIHNNNISIANINSSNTKTDTLDIRAITAAEKSSTGKRQKYRKTVYKRNAFITGSKPYPVGPDSKIEDVNYEKLSIDDPRASNIRIETRNSNFICMPSVERFSAHTGICQIIGSRNVKGDYHQLRVGDIIRFGSVGFLISEINTNGEGKSDGSMTASEIQSLIHRVVCQDDDDTRDLDSLDDENNTSGTTGQDKLDDDNNDIDKLKEFEEKRKQNSKRSTDTALCYICYDAGTEDDPLISPCKCSGDTKYIHLNCLKKWNTSTEKNEICCILDENENRKCSICQTTYPARTKLPNGKIVSLLPDKLKTPSMILILITKHSSSSLITNTRYQLSMNNLLKTIPKRPLRIGRSSQCDLILKYRTVSTIHAEMIYTKGEFYLTDLSSSNGTLKYLYNPTTLEAGKPLHVKFGRTIVSLKSFKKIRLPALFAGMITSRSSSSDDEQQQQNNSTVNNRTHSLELPSPLQSQHQHPPQRSPVHRLSTGLAGWLANTTGSLQRVNSVPQQMTSNFGNGHH